MRRMKRKRGESGGLADGSWESAARQVGGSLLSVIMPAFNLGPTIAANVRKVHALFAGRLPFEIVVVDDGSADNTRRQIEEAAALFPELRPVFLPRNLGKGAALARGFRASRGSYVLLLDADLDLAPHHVLRFFEIMETQGADVVIGSKLHPDSVLNYPRRRRLASAVYYGLVKLLIGLPIHDTQTGIKLYKREVLEWVVPRMLVKHFAFDLELLAIAHERGYRVAEAPVRLEFRGKWGSLGWSSVKQVMHDTLAIFYRTKILRYYQTIQHTEMPSPPPPVSIVVAYPAPSPFLAECLAGIAAQTYANYEVILLPDAAHPLPGIPAPTSRSAEPSVSASGASHEQPTAGNRQPAALPPPRVIPTGPLRPAEKRNVGIGEARGAIVAFLDDDAFPSEDWLEHALVYFADPEVAAVGGPGVTPPGDPPRARLGGNVLSNPLVSGRQRCRYTPTRVQAIDDYPSCNLLVRRETLDALGGFRTDFWPGEDTYLCLEIVKRLRRKIMYDPRALVYHHRRPLFGPHLRQIARYALHRGYFARRFPETSRRFSYMLPSLFVLGVAGGAAASAAWTWLRLPYAAALGFYVLSTLAATHSLSNPPAWALAWSGVVLTHAVYGARFLQGFFSRRMPSERRRFDHASEAERS